MHHSEIDDLDGVIVHHEQVAGLDIAVDYSLIVGRLQTAAGLADDLDRAVGSEAPARRLDQLIESHPGKQRHDEIRLPPLILDELSDIQDVDDVGMTESGKDAPFLVKHLDRGGIGRALDCLYRYEPFCDVVKGLIDDAHAALANRRAFDAV